MTASNDTVISFKNATILHRFASRAFWQTLSSDIFAGQIIASLIVLIFVAVFLLREWISQNARPGVFEEDEIAGVPPQDPPVPNPPPANQQPLQDVNAHMLVRQRQGPLDVDIEARRQARLWRPHRPIPPNPRFEAFQRHFDDVEPLELPREPIRRPQNARVGPLLVPPSPVVLPSEKLDTPPVDTGKGKEKEAATGDSVPTVSDVRKRMRRRFNDGDGDENAEPLTEVDPSFATSSFAASSSLLGPVSGRSTATESTPFEFTFRTLANGNAEADIREPVPEMPARSLVALQTAMMTGTPIPEEEEVPRRRSIVFSPDLSLPSLSPRAATPAPEDENDLKPLHKSPSSASLDPSFGQWPMAAEDSLGSSSLRPATPPEHFITHSILTSPSEVLAMDSTSMPEGNVERKKRTRDEMEEFEHYFRDPQTATFNPVDADDDDDDDDDDDRINVLLEVAHEIEHVHIADGEERPPPEVGSDEEDESEDDEPPERIFWDVDADREDEEEDEEDAVDIGDFNVPNRQGAQVQPQPQAPAEQLNDAIDDLEAAVEDDMEGALEGRLHRIIRFMKLNYRQLLGSEVQYLASCKMSVCDTYVGPFTDTSIGDPYGVCFGYCHRFWNMASIHPR